MPILEVFQSLWAMERRRPDGKELSWTSNRTANKKSQIFMAEWNDKAARESLGLH